MKGAPLYRKFILVLLAAGAAGAVVSFFYPTHQSRDVLSPGITIDRIVVEKGARKLSIQRRGDVLKTYRIALGRNPIGPKEQEGDMKTPEGIYTIDSRNPNSDFHLGLHLSYPSPEETARAAERGVNAGFDIMIHGLPNGHVTDAFHPLTDWTAGCIAVTDAEIEELWRVAPDGTIVEIRP
jgi:murein L,D-transpeptidase YafK